MFKVPEKHRITTGPGSSQKWVGNNGNFVFRRNGIIIFCIVSDKNIQEHVNVSVHSKGGKKQLDRFPTWEEMCFVKQTFWSSEDTVIQFHPPDKDYQFYHKDCLYLWRFSNSEILAPLPNFGGIDATQKN